MLLDLTLELKNATKTPMVKKGELIYRLESPNIYLSIELFGKKK